MSEPVATFTLWARNLWHSFREHSFYEDRRDMFENDKLGDNVIMRCTCGGVLVASRRELDEWRLVINDATCVRALWYARQRGKQLPQARLV